MRPFFSGWQSGDALAQSDNSRYTQYGNTALNNTGAQNREMLGHINTLQKYFMLGRGPDGQPLDPQALEMMRNFVNANQFAFSQGVMTPAPYDEPAGMPEMPTAPPGLSPTPYPHGTGPYPPPAVYPNGTGPYPPPAAPPVYPNGTGPQLPVAPPIMPQMPVAPPPAVQQQAQPQPKKRRKLTAFPGEPPKLKYGPRGGMTNFPDGKDSWQGHRQGRYQEVQ